MKSIWIGVAMVARFALSQENLVMHPGYTREARLARLEGRVEVEYSARADGLPYEMRITRSLGLGLDENALEAVLQSMAQTRPAAAYKKLVGADFILPSESRWHLLGVNFLVPEGASRPIFASTIYPPGTGISVHAFDEGRLVGAMGRQAFVKLAFEIDDRGAPEHFRILNASLDVWGDEAISLVSQWRFNPGRKGGEPVAVPCSLDLGWGPDDMPIGILENLKSAMNQPNSYSQNYARAGATYAPQPLYTPEARAAGLEGTVIISLVVREDGSPKDLIIVKSLGKGLDESALQTVSTWQFQSPSIAGEHELPVTVQIDFKLDPSK
jgi:TonB family protein